MQYSTDSINVVYCCSDMFSEVCAVSIASLFENNRHIQHIDVYIIEDEIAERNHKRFMQLAKEFSRDITFISLPDPTKFYNDTRFTKTSLGHTYARMILGDILPLEVERIISLDSDTMVLDKIDDLWNIDMGKCPIAGANDCMGRVALVKTQHMKPDSIHCNAGMFLINLETWREEGWTEQFHDYIENVFDEGLTLGGYEEEVINKTLGERMMVLHPCFNLMTLEQVLTYEELLRYREPVKYYDETEIAEAKRNPVLTHATNFFYIKKRIYEQDSDHPMRLNYQRYRGLTPWKNDPPMNTPSNFRQQIMKDIWHVMPRALSIHLARFVRNEIRPRLEKKRDDE
jgi:lipopolysaccharide biosynthesis glycosyltransferase